MGYPATLGRRPRLLRSPRITLVLWAPLILLTLAACGAATSAQKGGRAAASIAPPPPAVGPATHADLIDVRQAAAQTLTLRAAASLEFASPASLALPPILASGSFDLPRASGQELVHDPSGTETLVFQPTRVFDRPPPREAVALPQGRPWIRADFKEHVKGSSLLAQFLLRSEGRDPGFLLAEVAWGARAAAPLGRRVINGVPATGYRVRLDPALAAAAASGPRKRGFVRTIGFARQALGGSSHAAAQTAWIWVNRSHRVVSIRTSPPGSGVGTTLMTITSFGGKVRPTPPARSLTVDLAALTPAGDIDRD